MHSIPAEVSIQISDSELKKSFDVKAALNYVTATTLQWGLLSLTVMTIDERIVPAIPKSVFGIDTTLTVVAVLMFFLSLRSRIFSPLNSSRPRATADDPVFKSRLRPKWQPPVLAFPVIWSIITIVRTVAATLIYKTTGSLLSAPLLVFFAHLCIGDTWNTINNVEGRLGTSAFGVLFVLASVMLTTYKYYQTLPLAAYILMPSAMWLTVATVLVFDIWRVNYEMFNHPSFLPSKEEGPPSKWSFVSYFSKKL